MKHTLLSLALTIFLALAFTSCSTVSSTDDSYSSIDKTPDPNRGLLSGTMMEKDNGFTYTFTVRETRYGFFRVDYVAHKDCSNCPAQEQGSFSFAYDKCEAQTINSLSTNRMMFQGGSSTAFRIFQDSYSFWR